MRGKLRSIQVLRAIAVLAVLLYHAAGWSHGQAGVDLFFVISGVIIGIVMVGRSANAFIAARLWRIYPVYWFNALPLLAAAAVFGILTPARLAASLTLWPVWALTRRPILSLPGRSASKCYSTASSLSVLRGAGHCSSCRS